MLSLKIMYEGIGYRVQWTDPSYERLIDTVYEAFGDSLANSFQMTYTDEDGDTLIIKNSQTLDEAIRLFPSCLKVNVKPIAEETPIESMLAISLINLHIFNITNQDYTQLDPGISPNRVLVYNSEEIAFIGSHEGDPRQAWKYNLLSKTLTGLPMMIEDHLFGGVCTYKQQITVIGGQNKTVEQLNEETGKWTPLSPLVVTRKSPSVATHKNSILLFGGFSGDERLSSIERYDGDAWHLLQLRLPLPGTNFLVAFINPNEVFVSGGYRRDRQEFLNKSYFMNLNTASVRETTTYPYVGYIPTSNSVFYRNHAYFIVSNFENNTNHVISYGIDSQSWKILRSFEELSY